MATSPTLTSGLGNGPAQQVLRMLQEEGVGIEDYAAIGKDSALRADVVDAIFKRRLFSSPEEQICRMLDINANVWHDPAITRETIAAFGDPPARYPSVDKSHLYCVLLSYETGCAMDTFERNCVAMVYVHGEKNTRIENGHLDRCADRVYLIPYDKAKPRQKGLSWVVCELGRTHFGKTYMDGLSDIHQAGHTGLGQELPLVAAMHPRWARVINCCSEFPCVGAPEVRLVPNGGGDYYRVPVLYMDEEHGRVNRKLVLTGHHVAGQGNWHNSSGAGQIL